MESSLHERERAIQLLDTQLSHISDVFRDSYRKKGRGALIAYTSLVEKNHQLGIIDFNNRSESVELFDNEDSRHKISKMIDNYDPESEGILVLITKSNATWFVTVKLRCSEDSGGQPKLDYRK